MNFHQPIIQLRASNQTDDNYTIVATDEIQNFPFNTLIIKKMQLSRNEANDRNIDNKQHSFDSI